LNCSKRCKHLTLPVQTPVEDCSDSLQGSLISWFKENQRDLPWRHTYDPYHIWISEVMLQQTQMDRGVAYFNRWIDRFPNVKAVANAEQQEILKYWEGLGYYSRARNLHKAAKIIGDVFAGEVPADYDLLIQLPGIGPYTAAAVASVAGNRDIPVVDANVIRLYARIFDIDSPVKEKKALQQIKTISKKMLPKGRARLFNQALMEFGGLVCTPRKPVCDSCILSDFCLAFSRGSVDKRPVTCKPKKIITVERVAGIVLHRDRILLLQRREEDVWGGLWDFPGGELKTGEKTEVVAGKISACTGFMVDVVDSITTVIHHYTRYKIILHSFLCILRGEDVVPALGAAADYRWVLPKELDLFGFPAGPRKVLEYIRQYRPQLLKSDF